MAWSLGIDVGTTYTAAAIWQDGKVDVVALETHRVVTPTVIFAEKDEMLFGTPAAARRLTRPAGVASEFKRRVGDPVPLILSGAAYSADRLLALFAKWVVERVSEEQGSAPDAIVVTHPANWTNFQLHLLTTSLAQVGLDKVGFLTEPQAAAVDYAAAARVDDGELVLVYDLGGGTFDVSLLRREREQFVEVGEAAGVERLGGIDFDQAVFQHVVAQLPRDVVTEASSTDAGRMALAQLRRSCVDAKEALSGDVGVDIPVLLPNQSTTVRLARSEFEDMIRPMLLQTVDLVQRVMVNAGLSAESLSAALIVGGSSRIPLVSELVAERLAVPVRVDAHPKLVVARGAARSAGTAPLRAATPARGRRDRRPLAVAAVTAVVVVGAVGAFAFWPDGDDSASSDSTPDTGTASPPTSEPGGVATTEPADEDPVVTAGSDTSVPDSAVGEDECAEPSGRLAFFSDRSGDAFDIFAVDADGTDLLNLTNTPGEAEGAPAISPDGSLLAFPANVDGDFDIFLSNADGSDRRPLTQNEARDLDPWWSPDGTRLVFTSDLAEGNRDMWMIDADGSNLVRLTDDPAADHHPSWSPDGATIAFRSDRGSAGFDLYLLDVASGEVTVLLETEADDDNDPAWSPDGTKIAATINDDIHIIDVATRRVDSVVETEALDDDPAWSPDGCWISFTSDRGTSGQLDIVLMRSDGSDADAPRPLTDDLGEDDSAVWFPDAGAS